MTKTTIPEHLKMFEYPESGELSPIVIEDIKSVGYVEIVDIAYHPKGDFRADMSSQSGKFEYIVRGTTRNYSLGATNVIAVCAELSQFNAQKLPSPYFSSKVETKMLSLDKDSEVHFQQQLKNAKSRWLIAQSKKDTPTEKKAKK